MKQRYYGYKFIVCFFTLMAVSIFVTSGEAWSKGPKSLGVPGVRGGVITTSEPTAAEVGAEILREGGNAIDAAAAVQFALNVLEPQSSGIGGGGFMMIHLVSMIALIEPPMIAVMEPFLNGQKAVLRPAQN